MHPALRTPHFALGTPQNPYTFPMAPPVVLAATVIVLRDGDAGPEVFLVRRHHAIAFMAGAHVFPGGRVDPTDYGADDSWCDGIAQAAQAVPDMAGPDAVAIHVAAARELFEEAGVLLARRAGATVSLIDEASQARFREHQHAIHAGTERLHEVLAREELRLSLDALIAFAHWVTPPIEIRRFDTRFFVARVPPDQVPVHDDREAVDSVWVRPSDALAGAIDGRFTLPPPTWATLRELEPFSSVDETLAWARMRTVRRREPRAIEEHGVRRIVLPGDPSLPEPERVAFETRFILRDGRWRPETTR